MRRWPSNWRQRVAVKVTMPGRSSRDFFNVFNRVDYANPGLSLTDPRGFGVITSQYVPPNRFSGSRWIQLGMRVEF